MKITVLVENSALEGFACEHGLSLYIEHKGRKILLDSGTTAMFAENADRLGIDLGAVDTAVLSHCHYDHSGGFAEFFDRNKTAYLYASENAPNGFYSNSTHFHAIGIPENVLAHMDRFRCISENTDLGDGIYIIKHTVKGLEKIGERLKLYMERDGEIVPDDFSHEHSLVIDTPKGIVIFNSCSHGGAENIIAEAKNALNKPVYAYFGGLHMRDKNKDGTFFCVFSDAELDRLAEVIKSENICRIYTGHCTGDAGFNELKKRLGDIVQPMPSGSVIEL